MSPKDVVIFIKKADQEGPPKYELPPPLAGETRGVRLPNGDINWTCPCLGVLPYGPCGYEFRQFFSCLPPPGSDEAKGQECIPQFESMMECMGHFPKVYPPSAKEPELDKPPAEASTDKQDS